MKHITLSQRLNDILNKEKKELITVLLNFKRNTPKFNEFNEICTLWEKGNDELHAELNNIIKDQFSEIARQLMNLNK